MTVNSGGSGSGSRNVSCTILPNTTATPRLGALRIAGQVVHISQQSGSAPLLFNDVPLAHPYFDFISLLKNNAITVGCSANPPLYCPEAPITRGQMAVFIIRGPLSEAFSYQQNPYFSDTPSSHPHYKYVQKMKELGITSGCSATPALYCPEANVTRGQMAVFIMRGFFSPW